MPLGLSARESTAFDDQIAQMPTAVIPQQTAGEVAAENIAAPGGAILTGAAQTYTAFKGIATNFGAMGGYDPETGSVVEANPEDVQRKFAIDSTAIANQFKPDPRRSGSAAQFINSIGSGAVRMIGGTLVTGSPLGGAALMAGTEGVNTRNEIYAATGDKDTADKLAIGSALFSGVAALMPGGYGSTFASRVATGAVANTAFGVLQRDMMHTGLQDAGYTEMAKQYVPLDGAAMMADGILGTVFGGVHHMFAPAITDAARGVKDAVHAERAGPGLPTDPVSRQEGLAALDAHIDAMIRGDENPPPAGDVRYAPDAAQDAVREAAATEVQSARGEAIGKATEAPVPPLEPAPIMVEAPEFKQRFMDSKVVDDQGNPLPVYHGTRAKNFDEFQSSFAPGWGDGVYFTDNGEQAARDYGDEGRVIKAYVSIKNPWRGKGLPKGIENTSAWEARKGRWDSVEDAWQEDSRFVGDALRELGYDGVIADNSNDIRGREIVAFNPKQIIKAAENSALSHFPELSPKEGEKPVVLDPETQDALLAARDAIHAYPDMEVGGQGETPVRADQSLRQAMDDLKTAADDDELHRVALACAGRG